MRPASKYGNLLVATIIMAAMAQSIAHAQEYPPSASASVRTAAAVSSGAKMWSDQRHWQSFLKLAAKPNAAVTSDDLKKAFPYEAISSTLPGVYEISHVLRYSVSVPPRLHELYPERKKIYISFYFRGDSDVTACPDKEELVADLKKRGWKVYSDSPERNESGVDGIQLHLPSSVDLHKGDQGLLSLTYTNGCPREVLMQADKIRFDEVPSIHNKGR